MNVLKKWPGRPHLPVYISCSVSPHMLCQSRVFFRVVILARCVGLSGRCIPDESFAFNRVPVFHMRMPAHTSQKVTVSRVLLDRTGQQNVGILDWITFSIKHLCTERRNKVKGISFHKPCDECIVFIVHFLQDSRLLSDFQSSLVRGTFSEKAICYDWRRFPLRFCPVWENIHPTRPTERHGWP